MGKNNVVKLSKIITDDITKNTLKEVKTALEDIENMLSSQEITKEHILEELNTNKTQKLLNYLEQTERNILSLNIFADELNSKKRLLEYETKRALFF